MEYSPTLHSLCRLSAETGGRSKWSLVATDLPASICAGDQSSIFFSHSLCCLFSHSPRLVSPAQTKLWMMTVELHCWESGKQLFVCFVRRGDKLDHNKMSRK